MSTPALAPHVMQVDCAAGRVIEAEHAALADVEHCRQQALRLVVTSWLRAALLQKRTKARIKRLGESMAAAASLRQAWLCNEMETLAGDSGNDASLLAALDGAIVRVTEELAGIPESS